MIPMSRRMPIGRCAGSWPYWPLLSASRLMSTFRFSRSKGNRSIQKRGSGGFINVMTPGGSSESLMRRVPALLPRRLDDALFPLLLPHLFCLGLDVRAFLLMCLLKLLLYYLLLFFLL